MAKPVATNVFDGVIYRELIHEDEYLTEDRHPVVKRSFLVPWKYRWNFIRFALGYSYLSATNSTRNQRFVGEYEIRRKLPLKYRFPEPDTGFPDEDQSVPADGPVGEAPQEEEAADGPGGLDSEDLPPEISEEKKSDQNYDRRNRKPGPIEGSQWSSSTLYATDVESVKGLNSSSARLRRIFKRQESDPATYLLAKVRLVFRKKSYRLMTDAGTKKAQFDNALMYRRLFPDNPFNDELYNDSSFYLEYANDFVVSVPNPQDDIRFLDTQPFELLPVRYLTRFVTSQIRTIEHQHFHLKYVTNPPRNPPELALPKGFLPEVVPEGIYIWHEVPLHWDHFSRQVRHLCSFLGTVNLYHFDGSPPGTLTLNGMFVRSYRMCDGNLAHDFTFRVGVAPIPHTDEGADVEELELQGLRKGHNYQLNQLKKDQVLYSYVNTTGDLDGRPLFPVKDWNLMWTVVA